MIDWARFSARVPAGTIVRGVHPSAEWQAVLLENYPYSTIEACTHHVDKEDYEDDLTYHLLNPCLMIQDFDEPNTEYAAPNHQNIQYLIDRVWRSYDELMGDEA